MRKKKGLLALLLLALWVATDQHRLVVDRYECAIRDLPASFEGCRIVQLSDLHGASFGEDNAALIKKVGALRPDMIALTGDFVGKEEDLAVTKTLLPALTAIAPTYFVGGNHEWGSGLMRRLDEQLEESGAVTLRNCWVRWERGGESILLCGAEDPNSYADLTPPDALIGELRREEGEGCVVLLGHRNTWVEKYPGLDVDLILSGHCHGGIIRLPFVGGLISAEAALFPEYDAGEFRGERFTMIVSRGLGGTHHVPRIGNPPEIVLVTLRRQ